MSETELLTNLKEIREKYRKHKAYHEEINNKIVALMKEIHPKGGVAHYESDRKFLVIKKTQIECNFMQKGLESKTNWACVTVLAEDDKLHVNMDLGRQLSDLYEEFTKSPNGAEPCGYIDMAESLVVCWMKE